MSGVRPTRMAIAVVSFNTRVLLDACLASVAAAGPAETVVVDNGSTDGSIELVRERHADVKLIVCERNRGYGAAANRAIAACGSAHVLLLNSDTVLAADALPALESYLVDHPRAAVVGPRLVYPDGTLQRSTYPNPSVADTLLGETGLHLLTSRVPYLRDRSLRTWRHDVARAVPWVLGAALALRREAFEAVGGFDESFFLYGEEVDLCRRLAVAGYETHFAPVTTVVHVGGASTGQRLGGGRREYVVSKRRNLVAHQGPGTAACVLATLRAITRARLLRDGVRLRLSRDVERRRRLEASVRAYKSLLRERELWKP
jgi:GT2 family glycosyltransferase